MNVIERLTARAMAAQNKADTTTATARTAYWGIVEAIATGSEPTVTAAEAAMRPVGASPKRLEADVAALKHLLQLRQVDPDALERAVQDRQQDHDAAVQQQEAAKIEHERLVAEALGALGAARREREDGTRAVREAEALAAQLRAAGCEIPATEPPPPPVLHATMHVVADEDAVVGLRRYRAGRPDVWEHGLPLPEPLVPAAEWTPFERRRWRCRVTTPGTIIGGGRGSKPAKVGDEVIVTGKRPTALVEVLERLPDLPVAPPEAVAVPREPFAEVAP